jgi:ABC-2 type transport system ATP-binding protein
MSQRFSLYDDLRVEENMRFFGGIYGLDAKTCRKRAEAVLSLTGLTERRGSPTWELPGGLKQRLALGCALLHEPPLIFLDEPTSGVDPSTRRRFWDLIYVLADEGVTVFVTTHYMEEAEYCNRIGLIDQGRLIASGSPANLKCKHLSGKIYEITTDDVLAAVEALQKIPHVLDAAVFGRAVHVRLAPDLEGTQDLLSMLSASGLSIQKMTAIEPTLEDVFVALVGYRSGKNP